MAIMRRNMPRTWRISRKGKKKYIVEPLAKKEHSMPLLLIIRDMLNLAKTRKEALKIIREGNILVNSKARNRDTFPVKIFDFVSIQNKKFYQLVLEDSKLIVKEVNAEAASKRICKVTGKIMLKGKKVQLNLDNGFSFINNNSVKVNDSVVLDLASNKVIKHIPLKEKSAVLVIYGKNAGLSGTFSGMKNVGNEKLAIIKTDSGVKEIPIKNIMAVG